jgi:DNA-binding beta-propeller fold protein YncE
MFCVLGALILTGVRLHSQDPTAAEAKPAAVVRNSFEALQRGNFLKVVSLIHPAELKRFKAFAVKVYGVQPQDEEIRQFRALLAPFNTAEAVAAASASDLFAAFTKNAIKGSPDVGGIVLKAELQILGEVAEGTDQVHVITRTFIRPLPVSLQKHEGRWYRLLNEDINRLMVTFDQREHFRKKNLAIDEIQKKIKMDEIVVIGSVKDGNDVRQVLCRIKFRFEDFSFQVLGCYPVRKGEPAWDRLDDKDHTRLAEALRAKWFAAPTAEPADRNARPADGNVQRADEEKHGSEQQEHDEKKTLRGHTGDIPSVAFSPDGKRILSGSDDNTVKVWDAVSGQEILTLKGHTNLVRSVAFSPDGKRIVSGSWDWTVKVWDAASGRETLTLEGHRERAPSVAFSPDGKRIISGSWDKTVKVWDSVSGQEALTLKHSEAVTSVTFSPDGKRIVSASDDDTLKVWDATSGQQTLTVKAQTIPWCVAFSPDGKRIVSGGLSNTLRVWDATSGALTLALKGHTGSVMSVAFSPDGKRIVSGSTDDTLKIWDATSGQETLTLKGHTSGVLSVAFSPDGKRIVSGSGDKTIKLWEAASR